MAKKKYVDANAIADKIDMMATMNWTFSSGNHYYGGAGDLTAAINAMATQIQMNVQRDVNEAIRNMLRGLAREVRMSAIDGGQCYLCAQRDGEIVPENNYGSCGYVPPPKAA